ncbi:hypothetical protein, variant [Blastomyces dermatitidis ATCC 26199]|nr:hypothetical protein BDFG_00602 [Blastomyces dermatitidis ATCC 26199]EQL38234.1 hypothetical protein, variant [Blastomyces dermatitidis ATCC 26199]
MSKHALCLKSALTGLLFLAASRRRKRSESGQVGRKTMFDCRMAPLPQAPAACPDPRSTHEPPSRHGLRWSEDRQDRSSPSTNAVGWCGAGMSYVIFFSGRRPNYQGFDNSSTSHPIAIVLSPSVQELRYIEIPSQSGYPCGFLHILILCITGLLDWKWRTSFCLLIRSCNTPRRPTRHSSRNGVLQPMHQREVCCIAILLLLSTIRTPLYLFT